MRERASEPSGRSEREPSAARTLAGLVLAGWVGALAGLVLGEYELAGWVPLVAGVVVGVVLAEVTVAVVRTRSWPVAAVVAALAAASLLGAGWIDSDEGVEPLPSGAVTGALLSAGTAGLVASPLSGRRPGT